VPTTVPAVPGPPSVDGAGTVTAAHRVPPDELRERVERVPAVPPRDHVARGRAGRAGAGTVPAEAAGATVVIADPVGTDQATLDRLRAVLDEHGRRNLRFMETTRDDPGGGQAARALADGARLVVVCGGEGKVRAIAAAVAGSGVPVVLAPTGTGSLLARGLGLPADPIEALRTGLRGVPRPVDLALIEGDEMAADFFTAVSGAGRDAALVAAAAEEAGTTPAPASHGLGVLRELRGLRGPRARMSLSLDGLPAVRRTARLVVVANVGALPGRTAVTGDARPDDGLLHVLLLDPHGPLGWVRALSTLARQSTARRGDRGSATSSGGAPVRRTDRRTVQAYRCRAAEIVFDSEQPRQVDGSTAPAGRRLTARIVPGALTVLLPRER
jgi:diacylglycerol kinase family enzyme